MLFRSWSHNDQRLSNNDLEREAERQVRDGRVEPYRRSETEKVEIEALDVDEYDLYTKYIKHTMENHATLGLIKLRPQNDDCGSEEAYERPRNDG